MIIYEVVEEKDETEGSTIEKIKSILKKNRCGKNLMEMQQAYRIGKSLTKTSKERPIMVEFASTKKKK